MTDVQPVASVEGVEQMPDSTSKLQAAVNEYKKAMNPAQQKAALSGIVDIYMELIGENPTAHSIDAAGSLIGQFVVETEKTGDDAERPEDSNSWPNFHAKMTLQTLVMTEALLRAKSEANTAKIAAGVQGRMYDLRGNDGAF